jgi:hypothetical protein
MLSSLIQKFGHHPCLLSFLLLHISVTTTCSTDFAILSFTYLSQEPLLQGRKTHSR